MKTIIKVEGMSCQHCVKTIIKQLERAGVQNFNVQIGRVEIEISDNQNDVNKIKNLIEEAGYRVTNE